jgi:hypothetical protein
MADFPILSSIIPKTAIKVSFFDTDGKKVSGVTIDQANQVAKQNPDKKFYFQNGDGVEQELGIDAVNELDIPNLLPTDLKSPTGPQICGPPLVRFFGGGGFGASANAIISPISSSIIAFDIVNPGFGFLQNVSAQLIDSCGKGSGSSLRVNLEEDDEDTSGEDIITGIGSTGTNISTLDECSIPRKNFENQIRRNLRRSKKIKNITIISPGNGYIASPDGSLGGNERVWKEPDEGYVKSKCGGFYVVQPYRPIPVKVGDTYYPPDGPPRIIEEDQIITLPLVPVSIPVVESTGTSTGSIGTSYPVILVIDEVVVLDPGFGYRPGDEIIITPSEGAELEMIVDDRGQIEKVNVIKPGSGFLDLPSIKTNSLTGFNAIFSPILRAIRLEDLEQDPENLQLITVIDIVGRIAPKVDFDIVPR